MPAAWAGEPKTWAFQEGVESSEMNAELRDRLLYIGPITHKVKAADTSRSTLTLSDDPDLTLAVAANEKWLIDLTLLIDSNQTADFKYGWSFPSGTTIRWGPLSSDTTSAHQYWLTTAATQSNILLTESGTITDGSRVAGDIWGAAVRAIVAVSSTAGTVGFQWAQANGPSGTTILKANSLMIAHRVSP